jgi:HK97 family phage major capsid protein
VTTATIPTTADELEELLADPARLQDVMKDGQLPEFVQSYARAVHAKDKSIAAQVRDETNRVLAELLETDRKEAAKLNLTPTGTPRAAQGAKYNKRALGTAVDHLYEDLGDVIQTAWHGNGSLPNGAALQAKAAEARKIQNSFSSVSPGDGGFLIPETLRSELLEVALESSIVRPRATVVPMSSLRLPIPTVDDTSHASSVLGGVIAYWTEESGSLTSTSATFGRVVLEAKKLTGYSEVPNELLADAAGLSGWFARAFPRAISYFEDVAFINGSGAGEPLGFLQAPAAVSVSKETNQAADTILWDNILKMYARMLPSSLGSAVWIANQETFYQLATMALPVGTGGSAVWLNNGVEGPAATILGRPVIFTEKVSAIGDVGDINFVDLSYYLIGDRQFLQAAQSVDYKFANDQTAFRLIERVDGQPWLASAITPRLGSSTLSPFVKLAAR